MPRGPQSLEVSGVQSLPPAQGSACLGPEVEGPRPEPAKTRGRGSGEGEKDSPRSPAALRAGQAPQAFPEPEKTSSGEEFPSVEELTNVARLEGRVSAKARASSLEGAERTAAPTRT